MNKLTVISLLIVDDDQHLISALRRSLTGIVNLFVGTKLIAELA
jgi:hypothetical protein